MNVQGSALVNSRGPGLAVLYRWRLHEGAEESFVKAWTRVSGLLLSERGSLGSRLHRGPDGLWYSYAQWPSAEARTRAFALEPVDSEAGRQMAEAIAEGFPEIILESVSDLMILPSKIDTYPTTEARRSLATRFRFPYADDMQDWEWEVAETGRLGEFVHAYETEALTSGERFSLMEIIIQCLEDLSQSPTGAESWPAVERLLNASSSLHLSTIEYWARLGEVDEIAMFGVSARMRQVWERVHANAADA